MTEALTQAASYYQDAAETGVRRDQFDPYHGLNWIVLETLLGNTLPDAESWLARCEAAAVERYAASRKLWDAVASPDAEFARSLLRGALKADAVDTIVTGYREVFVTAQATPREQDSVVGSWSLFRQCSNGWEATMSLSKRSMPFCKGWRRSVYLSLANYSRLFNKILVMSIGVGPR